MWIAFIAGLKYGMSLFTRVRDFLDKLLGIFLDELKRVF